MHVPHRILCHYVFNEGLQSLLASTTVSLPPHAFIACPRNYFRGYGRGTVHEIVAVCVNLAESFVLHHFLLLQFFTPCCYWSYFFDAGTGVQAQTVERSEDEAEANEVV